MRSTKSMPREMLKSAAKLTAELVAVTVPDTDSVVEGDSETVLVSDGVMLADAVVDAVIEALKVAVTKLLAVELADRLGDTVIVTETDAVTNAKLEPLTELLAVAETEADADGEWLAVLVVDTVVIKTELCKTNGRDGRGKNSAKSQQGSRS